MRYLEIESQLKKEPRVWCVTGSAGFIGSHLVDRLLQLGQRVIGIDNFVTGKRENLIPDSNYHFIEADINDTALLCHELVDVDYLLHQAALGSVPRSLEDPLATNRSNVSGFLSILWAASKCSVRRLVYASSSSVYGDSCERVVRALGEEEIGRPLSPYAASKRINEIYADVFGRNFGLDTVGLRYFNVFGPRHDPLGAYAAVIPRWIKAIQSKERCFINGDGSTSRDFCYIENVVQANILAALVEIPPRDLRIFNISCGERTDLLTLFKALTKIFGSDVEVGYRDFREGDIKHSFADISRARRLLGYLPSVLLVEGLERTVRFFEKGEL